MSARYVPVGWNASKLVYDGVLLAAIGLYIGVFLWVAPRFQHVTLPLDDYSARMAAFGTCAFLLLTMILCIGPAARLDRRFLPLLYNRRHFGVMTCAVALTHADAALDWYFSYSPLDPFVALLSGNTSFGRAHGFPFEVFGIFGLLVLVLLAATSHDFWLRFLTPSVWKALHMGLYAGYTAVVLHVAFGALQAATNALLAVVMTLCVLLVGALHVAAGRRPDDAVVQPPWVIAGTVVSIPEGRAVVVPVPGAEPVAIFRDQGRLSAVTNLCAHQNGPLGEGAVVDGCITCPWHGFQYRLADGCAPPPYSERLVTFRLKLEGDMVLLDPNPNPPGTYVTPLPVMVGPDPTISGRWDKDGQVKPDHDGGGRVNVDTQFFVGWRGLPMGGYLVGVCLLGLVLFGGLALALGSAVNDPGGGDFAGDKDLTGVVVAEPYPLLVLDADAAHPNGHAVLLSGGGKRGVEAQATGLAGKRVRVTGIGFKRGSIDMVLVDKMNAADGPAPVPAVTPLGTWRLTGEICDGKCVSGVMRPGNGLAHKACANVCISGGVPPVLVTTAPVEGAGFLLMGDANGHALPDTFRDHTGIPQRMDGTVRRIADVLVFRTDVDAAATP